MTARKRARGSERVREKARRNDKNNCDRMGANAHVLLFSHQFLGLPFQVVVVVGVVVVLVVVVVVLIVLVVVVVSVVRVVVAVVVVVILVVVLTGTLWRSLHGTSPVSISL